MAVHQSDVAINNANTVMSLVQQLKLIRSSVAEIVAVNVANPLGTLWNALTTTALAADGSLGTVDGSPTNGHTIDSRVYAGLQRDVKNTDLINALQILVDFNTFCAGTSLTTNGARPAQINAVAM